MNCGNLPRDLILQSRRVSPFLGLKSLRQIQLPHAPAPRIKPKLRNSRPRQNRRHHRRPPRPAPRRRSQTRQLLSYFSSAINAGSTVAGYFTGGAATAIGEVTSGLGSVVDFAGGFVEDDASDYIKTTEVLKSKFGLIFAAYEKPFSSLPDDLFNSGDTTGFPTSVKTGSYSTKIANIFRDGNYVYGIKNWNNFRDGFASSITQSLIVTQLRNANYYILMGAHNEESCATLLGCMWLFSTSYPLESQGTQPLIDTLSYGTPT